MYIYVMFACGRGDRDRERERERLRKINLEIQQSAKRKINEIFLNSKTKVLLSLSEVEYYQNNSTLQFYVYSLTILCLFYVCLGFGVFFASKRL